MRFALSSETRGMIQHSTGLNHAQQCNTAITQMKAATSESSDYQVKGGRDIAPRGSIYLQMGRVMSLKKVKSYLKSI